MMFSIMKVGGNARYYIRNFVIGMSIMVQTILLRLGSDIVRMLKRFVGSLIATRKKYGEHYL